MAGFDVTFSVPKSVSVLWALSDAGVQRAIVAAHHQAVASTIRLIERDVARTRTGHGGTAHIPIRGLIAAGFDHHDSRAGDPQLHTHVTIANDPRPVEADLTKWARGHYPTEAAAQLLTRAFGGRFARPGWPWIARTTDGHHYIDAARLSDDDIGMLSGGEQRVLAITRSLLGQTPVDLSDALPGLDPPTSRLAINALTHATGFEEPPVHTRRTQGRLADVSRGPQREPPRGISR